MRLYRLIAQGRTFFMRVKIGEKIPPAGAGVFDSALKGQYEVHVD